jgi:hypothetical protein
MCQPRDESLSAGKETETIEKGLARRIDSDRKLNPRGKRDSSRARRGDVPAKRLIAVCRNREGNC